MYRATLRRGKTYRVGGVTFKAGAPLVVSEELGEYLKTVEIFQVEELAYREEVLEGLHGVDVIQAPGAEEQQEAAMVGPASDSVIAGFEDRKPRRTVKRGK